MFAVVGLTGFGPVAPGGPVAGWLSAAGWVWLTVLCRRALRSQRRDFEAAHVEGWIGEHRDRGGLDVVTLPVDQPLAYAVPRGPGQIVVSGALTATLEPAELEAVIAHEASHLRHRHHRYAADAAVHHACFGRVPFLRSSAAVLRLAVERWADEDAAPSPTTAP